MRSRAVSLCVVLLFIISIAVNRGACQANINEEQGRKPFDASSGSDLDSVSLTNGGLTLHIPLVSFPQRGSLDLRFFMTSSTKQWFVKTTPSCFNPNCTPTYKMAWTPVAGQIGARITSSVDWRLQRIESTDTNDSFTTNFFAVSPDGTAHLMGGSNGSDVSFPAQLEKYLRRRQKPGRTAGGAG